MKLKSIVADYAHKGNQGLEINLKALSLNKEFNAEVVNCVESLVPEQACVFIPGYDEKSESAHFNMLIKALILKLQQKALVTSDIKNLKNVQAGELVIIKQSFRTGQSLRPQIAELKAAGFSKVLLRCIITNTTGRLKGFGSETGVEVKALIKTDEIEYIPG